MDIYTVSLFGHRKIADFRDLENKMIPIIKNLLEKRQYVSFLIGRNGEFDEHIASIIKIIQKEYRNDNSDISLVLPYTVSAVKYYERYYDSIIIAENTYGAHPKSAITLKNRWMVEKSDLVLCYVSKDEGGAYTAMKYAERLGKSIINVYTKFYE